MTAPAAREVPGITAVQIALGIVALAALAVAQPLLDLVARNPAFLSAHQMGRADTAALGVVLPIVAPLALALAVVALGLVSRAARNAVAIVVLAVLTAVLALVVLRRTGLAGEIPGVLSMLLAAAVGGGVAFAWRRRPGVRRMLAVAAVAAPATALLFLTMSPASNIVFPSAPAAALPGLDPDAPPIVMIVLDEFPLVSLLRPDRTIDETKYPAFARLAEDGTWFRNATSMHAATPEAVPAILSGQYIERNSVVENQPETLFTMLGGTYDIKAIESVTQLCPVSQCESPLGDTTDYPATARDLAVVAGHMILPPSLTGRLASLDAGFAGFGQEAGNSRDAFGERFLAEKDKNIPANFQRFLNAIEPSDTPTLYFNHLLMPHRPWRFLPTGQIYTGAEITEVLGTKKWLTAWSATQGYQRHLLQVAATDRLVGQLIRRLEETGMYDDAMIAVVADHGVSFLPGGWLRRATERNLGELAAVPMFLKAPGQQRGVVSDKPVEIVDLAPTMIDVLGADIPRGLDGTSAYDGSAPDRTRKRFFALGGQIVFGVTGREMDRFIARKHRLFDVDSGSVDPYGIAPPGLRGLLGRRVPGGLAQGTATVDIDDREAYADVDTAAPAVPALVSGEVNVPAASTPPEALAIGVNGRIAAVTLLDPVDLRTFRALVPPETLRDGANEIAVFSVNAAGALTRLPETG